jgi:density-regulated protein DRP1
MALVVKYCAICSLLFEYCEYGPDPDKCAAAAIARLDLGESNRSDEESEEKKPAAAGSSSAEVLLYSSVRGRKKAVTCVEGLEKHGVKLKEATKKFKSKFACGSSVSEKADGTEMIIIQGDCMYDLPEYLVQTFSIPEDCIFNYDPKTKSKEPAV